MKKSILTFAAVMAFASGAQATNLFGNTTNNNQTYNQGETGGTGGQGGAGGDASANAGAVGVGVGVGVAHVNNDISVKPTINTNISNEVRNNAAASVIGSGNSNSTSKADATGGAANAEGGNVGPISIDASNNYKRAPVASALAYAPAPTATCATSDAIALQAVGFGFSWSGSDSADSGKRDDCWELEDIRAAFNYGDPEVAEEMLMARSRYAAAKERIAKRKQEAAAGK